MMDLGIQKSPCDEPLVHSLFLNTETKEGRKMIRIEGIPALVDRLAAKLKSAQTVEDAARFRVQREWLNRSFPKNAIVPGRANDRKYY
jgi:hypothetical protein